MSEIDLRNWNPSEFREWWPDMSVRLLVLLDVFRYQWGRPCQVSPAPGALGRNQGRDARSQHNVDRWGEVRAADIMPAGLHTREDARRAIDCAITAGFTGIGIYPYWEPTPGLHLDVRTCECPGQPATWGRVDGEYIAHTVALRHFKGV